MPLGILQDVINVDRLVRRAAGARFLVYLDQSALSALVSEPELELPLKRLRALSESGSVLFLRSPAHVDETLLAPKALWERIDALSDELATGIELRSVEDIEWAEIHAAAAAFVGTPPPAEEPWREAFRTDPQTPRDDLFTTMFGGSIRVRVKFEPDDWQIAEVEHEKAKERPLTEVYAELRTKGFTFEQMAEANLTELIRWKLPFVDPEFFRRQLATRHARWASAADEDVLEPGSSWSRMMAFAIRSSQAKHLLERFPTLQDRAEEFASSEALRNMPTLAFPALLRAAIANTPGRKAKESDGYDIQHLTLGLSRADVVTADSGMAQLLRDYRLVPTTCDVYGAREIATMVTAVEERCG